MIVTVFALAFIICVNVVDASFCDQMKKIYSPEAPPHVNITVYWDSDLTRAAAALLTVTLRHALGYQHVQLLQTAHNVSTADASSGDKKLLDKVECTMFTSVMPRNEYNCDTKNVTPTREKLHAHIAKPFRRKSHCVNMNGIEPYNDTRLRDCGFGNSTSNSRIMNVFYLNPNYNMTAVAIAASLNTSSLQLQYKELSRKNLFQMLRTGDESFLFLDYDMWEGDDDVSVVELHPCSKTDTIIAKRITNKFLVMELIPQLFKITTAFEPSLETLRHVLEIESRDEMIEEATCEWVRREKTQYSSIDTILDINNPIIGIFFCLGDEDFGYHGGDKNVNDKFINVLGRSIDEQYFSIRLMPNSLNCNNTNTLKKDLKDWIAQVDTAYYLGYVIGGVQNIEVHNVVQDLNNLNLPVLLYNAIDLDFDSMKYVWLTNGHLLHLALAIKHWINTTHLTVLTEPTPKAKKFNAVLRECGVILTNNYDVHHHLSLREADKILQQIKNSNIKNCIILVNTNNEDATTILSAAVRLNMDDDIKFTWIVREWSQREIKLNIKHVTFSFWYQTGKNVSINNNSPIWKEQMWLPKAMAARDAVLTLVMAWKDVFQKYPETQYDTRHDSKHIIQQFERSLIELSSLQAGNQNLTYKGHAPEEVVVYMDEWNYGQRTQLARFSVNATALTASIEWLPEQSRSGQANKRGSAFLHSYHVLLIVAMFSLLQIQ